MEHKANFSAAEDGQGVLLQGENILSVHHDRATCRAIQPAQHVQQRVAIARALAAAPAIILADEPTGNLDSKTSQDVLSLLKVTSQKFAQTIVMITHNEEIAQMADRIIRIEDGRIVTKN